LHTTTIDIVISLRNNSQLNNEDYSRLEHILSSPFKVTDRSLIR